ncbi:MAG: hypothetical protein OXD29_13220 [Roseovarius sp.]|nr:hypothetical protein [Roseovarius sp.]MCY4208893.1 hypothetical protein [Roseovarius sp.]
MTRSPGGKTCHVRPTGKQRKSLREIADGGRGAPSRRAGPHSPASRRKDRERAIRNLRRPHRTEIPIPGNAMILERWIDMLGQMAIYRGKGRVQFIRVACPV